MYCCCRSRAYSRKNVSWSRLIDSRNGNNKIHPLAETDEEDCDGGPGPPAVITSTAAIRGRSQSGDFTRSSLDLAPSLMTIYDNLAESEDGAIETNNKGVTEAVVEQHHSHLDNHENVTYISPGLMTSSSANMAQEESTTSSLISEECDDGDPSELISGGSDAKKRPLSVSSTSSSSTSSLPRHQRKKMASMATSPMANNVTSLHSPVAMDCSMDHDNNMVATGNGSKVAQENAMDMDITSDDEEEQSTTRGSGGCTCDVKNTKEESSAKCNVVSMGTGHGCTSSERLPCQEQLDESNDRIGFDNNNADHRLSYIDKVVAEILETERTYVRDLEEIIQGYQEQLEDVSLTGMEPENLYALFGNISDIYAFNRVLLGELENCDMDPVKVAQCFVKRNEGFVIYTDYCTNYPRAVEILTDCMRESATYEVFKQKQLKLRHSLPLGAYLLKPVQRILKYHLLLQNIVNNFDKEQTGYDTISQALESMTSMAQHINEMKRKHEHAVRIQEIQSQLSDWDGADLTTYGDLVLEDAFRMYGAKAERHLFLFEKCLLIAKKAEDGILACKHCIECSNLMLVESIPKEPLSFHVIPWDNPKMQVTVQAKNLEQKRRWCQDIKRLILENYNAVIPDKAKELVMMLGKSKEEDDLDTSLEPTPTRKHHTAPEYLEKRRVRRKSATILPDFGLLKGKKSGRRSEGSPATRHLPPQRRRSEAFIATNKINAHSPSKLPKSKAEASPKTPSTGSRFGSFFMRNRSRSLESIDLVQSKLDLPTNKKRNSRETDDEDDAYSRPDSQCSDVDDRIYDHLEASDSFCDEDVPEKERSPLRKSDSFRIATKLNRIDSKRVVDDAVRNRFKVRKDERRRNRNSLESSDYGTRRDSSKLLDDGYVSVKFTDSGFQLDQVDSAISPTRRSAFSDSEENLGDYIELAAVASNRNVSRDKDDSNNNSGQNTERISRQMTSPRSAKFSSWLNKHNGARNSASAIQSSNGHRCLQKSNSFTAQNVRHQELIYEDRTSRGRISSDPTKSRTTDESVYDNYAAAIYGPLIGQFSRSDYQSASANSSPRRSTPNVYLRSNARHFTSHFTNQNPNRDSPSRDDPWVLQNESNTPSNLTSAKKTSVLRRSNSLSSMCDSLEDMRFRKFRGHKKKPSDTLVFSNRSAFIATSIPRTIRQDIETERAIARLGTPPRERGPSDFTDEVNACKERGRIVARYATPPRAVMEPPKPHQSESEYMHLMSQSYHGYNVDETMSPGMSASSSLDYATPASMMSQSFSTSSPSGTGHDMWRDLEEYIKNSPDTPSLPKFPVFPGSRSDFGDVHGRSASLPRSETAMSTRSSLSSASSTMQSPLPTSPNSPFFSPGEGIVDSLKNAVFSITSRITGRGTRSVGSSPVRSRSASALEDLRVRPPTPPPMPVSEQPDAETRKEKRNRFVYNLARQYSMRIKNSRPRNFSDRKAERDTATLARQLAALLKENRQGGNVIGARMASTKPVVLGTYTLQRHRPRRPAITEDNNDESDDEELCGINFNLEGSESRTNSNPQGCLSENAELPFKRRNAEIKVQNHDSGCPDMKTSQADQIVPQSAFLNIKGATVNASPDHSPTPSPIPSDAQDTIDSSDENSSIYFYERRFLDDLESNFGEEDDVFRDSAVYSDDGTGMDADTLGLKMSIRDTVRLIEQRYKARPIPKIEVKKKEKAHAIKEIMKCLETNTSFVKDGQECIQTSECTTEKVSPTRNRELVECATLTRIRQNSLQIGENIDDCSTKDEAAGHAEGRSTDSESNASDLSPTKKGWVKEVVHLLEHEQLS